MPTITCPVCDSAFLTYDEGTAAPTYAIVSEGATPPAGVAVVHTCPNLPPVTLQPRASAGLDWTDEQERAAVAAALSDWELAADDEIVCMRWYTPGTGREETAAVSAPLTVQVRRAGVDLKYAGPDDMADVSFGAAAAIALIDQLGIELPKELADAYQADLVAEEQAAIAAQELLVRKASSSAEAAAVWEQALAEARQEAEAAAAHAKEHPDNGDLQILAAAAQTAADQLVEKAAATRAEADEAAAAAAAQ